MQEKKKHERMSKPASRDQSKYRSEKSSNGEVQTSVQFDSVPKRNWRKGVNFLYERRFGSFYYVHVTRVKLPKWHSYEKFVHLTLMKLAKVMVIKCWWNWLKVRPTNFYLSYFKELNMLQKTEIFFSLLFRLLDKSEVYILTNSFISHPWVHSL